jgi:hypothetical protein
MIKMKRRKEMREAGGGEERERKERERGRK